MSLRSLRARNRHHSPRLHVEPLEHRRLLHGFTATSVVLNGTVLEVTGDKHPNVIVLEKVNDKVVVEIDGQGDPSNPAGYSLASITRIVIDGTSGNDQITVGTGVAVPASILGGRGNDTVTGGGGDDTIDGGVGNDSLSGGSGDDWLLGGAKNDVLSGDDGDDVLDGGVGVDFLNGGSGQDILQNDMGRETVTGGADADLFAPMGKSGQRTDLNASEDIVAGAAVVPGSYTANGLLGTRTDLVPGAPLISERHHVLGAVDYASLGYSNPPAYGPHHARFATKKDRGSPVQPTGIYITEMDDADIVHNLEHGHVWIAYDPVLLSAADVLRLQAIVRTFGSRQGILLTPRTANDHAIALVSWAHLLTLPAFELDTIARFIVTNRGHAPEGFITP